MGTRIVWGQQAGMKPFFPQMIHDFGSSTMVADRVGASMGAAKAGSTMGGMDGADGVVLGLRNGYPFEHSEQHSHSTGTGQSATSTVKLAKLQIPSGILPVKLLFSNSPVSGFEEAGP